MAAVELAKKVHVHTGAGSSVADADEVTYDGTAAGLAATDVQAAIDEVDGDLDAHLADAAAAHAGSAVSFTDAGLAVITGVTDVQAALAAVDAALDDRPTNAEASAAYAASGHDHSGTYAKTGAFLSSPETRAVSGATETVDSGATTRWPFTSLADAATQEIAASWMLANDLPSAATVDLYVWHWNPTATTGGDVVFTPITEYLTAEQVRSANDVVHTNVVVTVAAQWTLKRTLLASGITVDAAGLFHLRLQRAGAHVSDTHAAAYGVVGVELVKAS